MDQRHSVSRKIRLMKFLQNLKQSFRPHLLKKPKYIGCIGLNFVSTEAYTSTIKKNSGNFEIFANLQGLVLYELKHIGCICLYSIAIEAHLYQNKIIRKGTTTKAYKFAKISKSPSHFYIPCLLLNQNISPELKS